VSWYPIKKNIQFFFLENFKIDARIAPSVFTGAIFLIKNTTVRELHKEEKGEL
jgi:hypothetical protein